MLFDNKSNDQTELEKLKEENEKLKNELNEKERVTKINYYAEKLGVEESSKKSIEENYSFEDALKAMVDEKLEKQENFASSVEEFDQSGSTELGSVSVNEENEEEITTRAEAIKFISKRDGVGKKEASYTAIEEYPELFKKEE